MKIGISRPSQTIEQSLEVLELARAFGFEGVQLKPAQYNAHVAAPETFAERYAKLANLAAGGLIFYPSRVATDWPAQLEPILHFAAKVGASHICICSGVYATTASDEEVQTVANVLTEIGQRAQSLGLVISIHNHVASVVESETDIARLLDRLDPKRCGLTLDTAHAAKAGIQSVPALIARFQKHLLNVHLKDLDADGKFCALGTGTLDMRPILRELKALGYDQWLIVDEETVGLSTREAFEIARDYLQREGVAGLTA